MIHVEAISSCEGVRWRGLKHAVSARETVWLVLDRAHQELGLPENTWLGLEAPGSGGSNGPLILVDRDGVPGLVLAAPGIVPMAAIRRIWFRGSPGPIELGPIHRILPKRAVSATSVAIFLRGLRSASKAAALVAQHGVLHGASDGMRGEASGETAVYEHPIAVLAARRSRADGLSSTEARLAERHLRCGQRILDVGCGAGREALGFARLGLRVHGIDLSSACIALAEEARLQNPELTVSFERRALEETRDAGSFDAIFFASDVYSTIQGRRRRVEALRACLRKLAPGGLVLIPAHVAAPSRTRRWLVEGPRRFARRFLGDAVLEAGDSREWRLPERGCPTIVHRFESSEEVLEEASLAGLALIDRVASYFVLRAEAFAHDRYRPRANVVSKALGDELLVVDLETGQGFRLNGTGRRMWLDLESGATSDEIVDGLARLQRAAPRPVVEEDARAFVARLLSDRLIEPIQGGR